MGEFNPDDPYTYYCGQESFRRNADDTTLMAESEKELKSLSMKVKEE